MLRSPFNRLAYFVLTNEPKEGLRDIYIAYHCLSGCDLSPVDEANSTDLAILKEYLVALRENEILPSPLAQRPLD